MKEQPEQSPAEALMEMWNVFSDASGITWTDALVQNQNNWVQPMVDINEKSGRSREMSLHAIRTACAEMQAQQMQIATPRSMLPQALALIATWRAEADEMEVYKQRLLRFAGERAYIDGGVLLYA